MKTTRVLVTPILALFLAITAVIALHNSSSQAQTYSNRKQFLDIDELSMIIKNAKAVGMSEEELRTITIQYDETELNDFIEKAKEAGINDEDLKKIIPEGEKKIVVIEYINLSKRLTQLRDEKLKKFLSKKFLTVNDVFNELVISEPETIQKLREELVSER